jgi:N-methylhydantoinase A
VDDLAAAVKRRGYVESKESRNGAASLRIGVDVGGTFCDLVILDEATGEIRIAKGPSTPTNPDEGVVGTLRDALSDGEIERAKHFLHGSTVALNALIERKGATVGLLTTAGFRDVLELRRGERIALTEVRWQAPRPLVPRRLRLEVRERVLANGQVDRPLELGDLDGALETFESEGVTCIAVCLLNSFANPEHEIAIERALRERGFSGPVSLSHRISGEYKEYERTSTTAIDAYVRPRIAEYLSRLEQALQEMGFGGDCLITTSGGSALLFREAEERPFETVMSGPAAGAVASGELCKQMSVPLAVTADVGGTSFDTCLIRNGLPEMRYQGEIEGMPLQAPWLDVRSIGAGGGSVAYIDAGGLLRVGPDSAGADPGPACYGRGGDRLTVTDAAAILGMLAFGELAGGVTLDFASAERAAAKIAAELGRSPQSVAQGVLQIAASNMSDAIREVTLEQGEDAREAVLVAFGGAGPLFATLLAKELEMKSVLIPRHAGNFSALGLLYQDLAVSTARTLVMPLENQDALRAIDDLIQTLFSELDQRRKPSDGADGEICHEAFADVRYIGQEYSLTVPLRLGADRQVTSVEELNQSFLDEYGRTFGRMLEQPTECVSIRVRVRNVLPKPSEEYRPEEQPETQSRSVQAFSFTEDSVLPFAVVDRSTLGSGKSLEGPAILLEPTTTTYLDSGYSAEVEESGALNIFEHRRSE